VLSYVQFPWRFLGPGVFFLSFISGTVAKTNKVTRSVIIPVIVLLAVLVNFRYFRPEHFFKEETDQKKLSGESFIIQQKSAILDYLPETSPIAPKELAFEKPIVVEGDGFVSNYSKRSNSFFFDVELYSDSKISIPIIYYPGWIVIVGNTQIHAFPDGNYGAIALNLPEGKHIVQGRFTNTKTRSIANAITVITFCVMFIVYFLKINEKEINFIKRWKK
jgi:hypothetical protein